MCHLCIVVVLCVGVGHMSFLCVCYHPVCWSQVYAGSVFVTVLCAGVGYMPALCLLSPCVLEW